MSIPRRIAALVKQVPRAEHLRLDDEGRLVRTGADLEMNPYCRRAVSKGVELANLAGGSCTVVTLGPPAAEDVLREALAWGATDAVLVTDPAFAGSDTLATARALAAALRREGPFDLVLVGRNSVDADTGQVGPELAELLGVPFAGGVRQLDWNDGALALRCEHDDGWARLEIRPPAVLSVAERLCEPAKVPPEGRAAVERERIRIVRAADLGPGPWGQAGSPTRVGEVRMLPSHRERRCLRGDVRAQVREAVSRLAARGALPGATWPGGTGTGSVPRATGAGGPAVGVLVEADRPGLTAELLGVGATFAARLGGTVTAIGHITGDPAALGRWGADEVRAVVGSDVEEDLADVAAEWAAEVRPRILLAPGTAWGREVASRVAVRLGAGLTGDAVDLELQGDALVAWKPAFGGSLVAAITSSSSVQMATVRPGVLPRLNPGDGEAVVTVVEAGRRGRVRVLERRRDDDVEVLARANVVVTVGSSVAPERYAEFETLRTLLGAEWGATRKVTDRGWMPRARQIGITGRSVAPRLYLAFGVSGKLNHTVGVRGAGTVLAVNTDPLAPIFNCCDVGIVADWEEVLPVLTAEIRSMLVRTGNGAEQCPSGLESLDPDHYDRV